MKISRVIIFLAIQLICFESQALITITGTTNWTLPTSLNDDVLIESTGQLNIYADVEIEAGREIRIKNGGSLYAIGARFFGKKNNFWNGIVCEPYAGTSLQNLLALKLIGCTIEDANVAVTFDGGPHRNYHIRTTTFKDNGAHLHTLSNTKMSFQSSEIISCQFLGASIIWPILMHKAHNVSVYNSFFDYSANVPSSATRGIHMDGPENVLIKGNTFSRVGRYSVSIHYQSENIQVIENTFSPLFPFPNNPSVNYLHAAVELGVEVPSTAKDILIERNEFVNTDVQNSVGLIGVLAESIEFDGLQISENIFQDYGRGIDIENVQNGTNAINNNTFNIYDNAIKVRGTNTALDILDISCNEFLTGNSNSVAIDGTQGSMTSSQVYVDPGNEFVNADFDILYNTVFGYLEYAKHASNPYPPSLFTGVNMSSAISIKDCTTGGGTGGGGDPSEKSKLSEPQAISIYPNPAHDFVFIEYRGVFSYCVRDGRGAIYTKGKGEDSVKLPIHELTAGVYFVEFISYGKSTVEKLIVN